MRRILSAIILSTILNSIPHFFEGAIAWHVWAECMILEMAMWTWIAMSFIPYKKLQLKSILAIWIVTDIVDFLLYPLWFYIPDNVYLSYSLKFTLCVAWLCFIWFRNYERENDVLDDEHFFKVGIRPADPQDFLLSLIREPIGGTGIYACGNFYHYRKGKLVVEDKKYIMRAGNKYRIYKMRKIDLDRLNMLDSLIHGKYSAWSWIWNCKTVLEPILSKRGKPLFHKTRREETGGGTKKE